MTGVPKLLVAGRLTNAILLPVSGMAQAAAIGLGAFATRDAFAALHDGVSPSLTTLSTVAGSGLAAGLIEVMARRRSEALGQSYVRSLRGMLYGHLAGMDRRSVSARRLGGLSLRFVADLSAARRWFGRALPRLVSGAVVLPAAGAVLWHLHPILAMVAAGPLLLSLAAMAGLATGLGHRQERLRARRAALAVSMMERLSIAPDLDLMLRTERELRALDESSTTLGDEAVSRATRVALLRLMPQIGAAAGAAAVLSATAILGLAPGLAAAVLAVLAILVLPMREFATCWDDYCAWRVARTRAEALLALPSLRRLIRPRGRAVDVQVEALAVAGGHVTARVQAGGVLAIAGPPGSGKSELAGIVAGVDRPAAGRIWYDDDETTLPRIALLTDRPPVLKGSLRRALTIGITPRPADREIRRLSRSFGLSRLVNHGGLAGLRVGEAGRTLSRGELLRVALARIALSRPDLIVLDSPDLSADPEGPALVTLLRAETAATLVIVAEPGRFAHDVLLRLPQREIMSEIPTP